MTHAIRLAWPAKHSFVADRTTDGNDGNEQSEERPLPTLCPFFASLFARPAPAGLCSAPGEPGERGAHSAHKRLNTQHHHCALLFRGRQWRCTRTHAHKFDYDVNLTKQPGQKNSRLQSGADWLIWFIHLNRICFKWRRRPQVRQCGCACGCARETLWLTKAYKRESVRLETMQPIAEIDIRHQLAEASAFPLA